MTALVPGDLTRNMKLMESMLKAKHRMPQEFNYKFARSSREVKEGPVRVQRNLGSQWTLAGFSMSFCLWMSSNLTVLLMEESES